MKPTADLPFLLPVPEANMGVPIRILLVEDQADDLAVLRRHLSNDGYQPTILRVETSQQLQAALDQGPWDAIISDYTLPTFDAPAALSLLQASGKDLPFIVLTGSIGEERAAAIMKAGAHDFILKHQLSRLTASIKRAMGDAQLRAAHRDALINLRSTNVELSTLIDASPLGIIAMGPTGLVRRWNRAAERLFGWQGADVLGKPLPAVPMDGQIETAALLNGVLQGRAFTAVELRWQRHDHSAVDVAVSMAPLRTTGASVEGIIALVSDMTERKNMEKQLQQTQKMEIVGRLAGGIAHDSNNLLTVINGRCQLLLDQLSLSGQDAARRNAELILETGERAALLMRQLLAFSRRQIFQVRDIDVNRAVTDIRKMLDTLIGEDIDLTTSLQPGLQAIRTDPSQFEQVMLNLVINARDAMPQGASSPSPRPSRPRRNSLGAASPWLAPSSGSV
jgi:two-component system, cell cycle sensor histidine kinase and response regulator CckA